MQRHLKGMVKVVFTGTACLVEVTEGDGAEAGNEFLVGGVVGHVIADNGGLACTRFDAGKAGGRGGGCDEQQEQEEVGGEWRHN